MNTAIKRPFPGDTVAIQHWDGSVEKATIIRYDRGAVLIEYADKVEHWWLENQLLAAMRLSN